MADRRPARSSYHHGDLRRALIDAGLAAARESGPDGVTLRDATRAAGVTTNAAYRHFADRESFLVVLASAAQRELALHIESVLDTSSGRAHLHSVGRGYVDFARAEPGWFRTAFLVPADLERAAEPDAAGGTGRTPFQLLSDALDHLVDDGELPPAARSLAEVPCWSAVHGFAMLAVLGPLRAFADDVLFELSERTIDVAVTGLISAATVSPT